MKAPDKIYLNFPEGQTDADVATWDTKAFDDCENVEYIRKDYLLKKIRKTAIWNTIKVGKADKLWQSWEDIRLICEIDEDMRCHSDWPLRGQEVYYEEVLRRFREMKDK